MINKAAIDDGQLARRLLAAESDNGGFIATTPPSGQPGGTMVQIGTAGSLVFNITYDSSVNSAPAGFTAAFVNAIQYYESQFNDPITINIAVGWGEIAGQSLDAGAVGESETFLDQYSYSQLRAALAGNVKSADDAAAVNSLPSSSPISGGSYMLSTAQEKALGLASNDGSLDGYIGFGDDVTYTFDPNNRAVSGQYDFIGVAEHEITEVMGRIALLGQTLGTVSRPYSALDLFRYSAAGTRQVIAGRTAYFSLDGGNTNLNNFNTRSDGDFGDWASSAGNDSYNAFGNTGVANLVSGSDLRVVDVLGYDRTSASGTTSPSVPQNLQLVGSGDFDANRLGDVAFTFSGQIALWLNQNGVFTEAAVPNASMGVAWTPSKIGDFNGDKAADLLWTNSSGQVAIWELNGANLAGFGVPSGQMGAEWHVAGVADFNGDGNADIFWTSSSGSATVWSMNGTSLGGFGQVNGHMGAEWSVVGTGDFNGNGKADVLWKSTAGDETIWGMNGSSLVSLYGNVGHMGAEWRVAGVGNFNADQTDDIVWVDTSNNVQIWDMANGLISQIVTPAGHDGSEWHLDGVGNFVGTGNDDLLWLTSTGATQVWHVSGSQVQVTQPASPANHVLLGI